MIPSTVARVRENTDYEINQCIQREIEANVALFAAQGDEAIARRLRELDREWDVERTLEANAATAVLVSSALGFTINRRFLALPIVIGGFLLQHAVQGWCPPLPILRRLGFRTESEINQERFALKALRGDFDRSGDSGEFSPCAAQAMTSAARV